MSIESLVEHIRKGLLIESSGRKSESLDSLREILLFVLAVALGFAVEKYAGPEPDRFHDNADVIQEEVMHFKNHFPYSTELGFKTEFHTFTGRVSEEQATYQTNLLFNKRETIDGYDKLLVITYWPDEPKIKFRASKLFGELHAPDVPLTMVTGANPTYTPTQFLESHAWRLVEQLPENYQTGEKKLSRGEFNRYLFAATLVISIVGLLLLTVLLGIAGTFGIDSFFYILSFGSLPLLLYADYSFENLISDSANSLPWVVSAIWLASGVLVGLAMRIAGLQQLGSYIIRRHLPFALAVFGFRQSNLAVVILFIIVGALVNWLIYRNAKA